MPAETLRKRMVQDCDEQMVTPMTVLLQGGGITWAWRGICSIARRKKKNHVPSTAVTSAGIAAQRSTTNGMSKGRAQLGMIRASVPAGPAEVWGSSGWRISTAKGGMGAAWGGTVGIVDPCAGSPASGNVTAALAMVVALEQVSAANPTCQHAAAKIWTLHDRCCPELMMMRRASQLVEKEDK